LNFWDEFHRKKKPFIGSTVNLSRLSSFNRFLKTDFDFLFFEKKN